MAYIGNSPANVGNYQVVDDISSTFNGTLTSFALTALTLPINPAKSGQLLVSINGVLQEPDDTGAEGFKVSGSNIVFSSAPATGSTFWAVWQGHAVDIGTPSDGVVGTAQMSYPLDNFTSTGIDDNATSTKITVADTGIDVTGPITATDFVGPLNGAVQFTAKNDEGVAITKGQVVYIKGVSGDVATVGLADANDSAKMPAFGLVFADANNNAEVEIVSFGSLKDTKTDYTGWSLGDTLYVSTTAGALTNSAPTGETSSIQNIGKIQRVHASAGIIKAGGAGRTNATPNLDDGNVFIGNASNQAVSVALSTVALSPTGDGSGLTGINTDLVSDTTPQLGGDLDLNGHVITGLNSSNLSVDFTVEAGKTVTAGEVVNFAAGKIGDNPVVNTQTTLQVDSTYDNGLMNASGTIAVRPETNASGHHQVRTGVVQTDGSITWNSATTLHTGDTTLQTNLIFLDDDKFYIWGRSGNTYTDPANTYVVCFSVNPTTGSVAYSTPFVHTASSPQYNYSSAQSVIKELAVPKFILRVYQQQTGNVHWYDDYTFTWADSGSLTNNTSCDPFYSSNSPELGSYLVQSNAKLLQAVDSTTWKLQDWNGSYTTNTTDVTFDTSYASGLRVYRISGVDKFVALFKNTSNVIKLNTYTYASGSITKTNDHTVLASGAGVSLGSLVGSGNNIVIGYEDDSKGYVATFTLDNSTYAVNGTGLSVVQNTSNTAVQVNGPHNTNKYTTWFNTGGRVNSNIVTANAYATSALNWIGVAATTASGGATSSVVVDGVASGFSGLTQGSKYYYDTASYDGSVTTTVTDFLIGTAISTTEINLNA